MYRLLREGADSCFFFSRGEKMGVKSVVTMGGRLLNEMLSLIVFSVLDLVDMMLCYVYKVADFLIEAEWKACYCSPARDTVPGSGRVLVSESTTMVRLTCSKLQLEEISDTLYTRPSLVSEVSKSVTLRSSASKKSGRRRGGVRPAFTVSSTVVDMLQGRIGGLQPLPIPRWSDCNCKACTSWTTSCKETLFVKVDGAGENAREDVVFIHGFISTSSFWTETLYPKFSKSAKSKYRLFAVDLLGFGRSPKPTDSLYTLREHLDMIERSVFKPYKVKSFHIVAHSLGCILALALAVKHPSTVKSLTLLAPPYFPIPRGEQATAQYMMRQVAPRRVWPAIAFGASLACWYEHISRTICLVMCKNHRMWEFLAKLLTRNRMRTYLLEGFFQHTHNAAWHTLHNVICGSAGKMEGYLEEVKNRLKCEITIFHGRNDEVTPVECSFNLHSRIPRAHLKLLDDHDHITIVVGRQQAFARELEAIWRNASPSPSAPQPPPPPA